MLHSDPPARIPVPGTHAFAPAVAASYTIGRGFVAEGIARLFRESSVIAADIETFGLGLAARRLKCVTFGNGSYAVVLDPRDPYQADLIKRVFARAETLLFHNSPFDVPILYMNGLIELEHLHKVKDTLIYARLANPGDRVRKNLTDACDRYLQTGPGGQLEKAFKALGLNKTDGYRKFDLDRPIYQQGAASDPILTYRLYEVVRQAAYDRLTRNHPFGSKGVTGPEAWDLVERENILNAHMGLPRSCKGFRVDFDYADQYREVNSAEVLAVEQALQSAGVRPGNGQDLLKVLEGHLPPDHPRTKTGLLQADEKALSKIAHPLAEQFRSHKKIVKVGKDYIDKVVTLADENGRVHPTLSFLAAATGRAAMGDPPLHQFSGPARGILCPDDGDTFTSIDLSQGEPVTIANAAGDVGVIAGYEAGRSDLYTELGVGSGMLPAGTTTLDCELDPAKKKIRSILKVTLLAQLYGEGFAKLTADLGLDPGPWEPPSQWEVDKMGRDPQQLYPRFRAAKAYRSAVYRAMPQTEVFVQKLKKIATETQMMVTISGRILDIPSSMRYGRWEVQSHKGVNYFCQGGQYDLLADAMLRCVRAGLGSAIYLTMHDELVVSTDAAPDIRKILETPAARLELWAKRKAILRTDSKYLGEHWAAA